MSDERVPAKTSRATARQKLEIAHQAYLSLRAVEQYFAGKQQRDGTRGRIVLALKALNLEHLRQPDPGEVLAGAGR